MADHPAVTKRAEGTAARRRVWKLWKRFLTALMHALALPAT
jgi:hypothetical protein